MIEKKNKVLLNIIINNLSFDLIIKLRIAH
jgi:hypothetical protein